MTLTEAVESYLSLKRALGAVFSADTRILRSFVCAVGDVPLESIHPEACQAFCRGTGPPTRFWERKHYTLRGFFGYLVARGHLLRSPLPEAGPQIRARSRHTSTRTMSFGKYSMQRRSWKPTTGKSKP